MKSSIRFLIVLGVCFSLSIAVSAQETSIVQSVTVNYYEWSRFAMAPDDHYLAVFQEPLLLGDPVIDSDLLAIKLVDLTTDPPITHTLTGHIDYATDAVFSSDSSRLLTLHSNGDINIWDTVSREITRTIHTRIYGQGSRSLILTPDGQTVLFVANAGAAAQVYAWNTDTGYLTSQYGRRFETYYDFREFLNNFRTGEIFSAMGISPDGNYLLTATGRNGLWLWPIEGGAGTEIKANTEDLPRLDIRRIVYLNENRALYHHRGDAMIYIVQIPSGLQIPLIQEIQSPLFDAIHDNNTIAWMEADGITVSYAPVTTINQKSSITINLPDGVTANDRAQGSLFLFAAGTNKVAVGGYKNEELDSQIIYIVTVNE